MAATSSLDGRRWIWADTRRHVLGGLDGVRATVAHPISFPPHVALLLEGYLHAGGATHDLVLERDDHGVLVREQRLDGMIVKVSTAGSAAALITIRHWGKPGWTVWSRRAEGWRSIELSAAVTAVGAAGDMAAWVDRQGQLFASWASEGEPRCLGVLPSVPRAVQPSADRRFVATLHEVAGGREVCVWRTT